MSVAQPSQRRMSFKDEVATIASTLASKSRMKRYQYDGKLTQYTYWLEGPALA